MKRLIGKCKLTYKKIEEVLSKLKENTSKISERWTNLFLLRGRWYLKLV
jgi:hypothetical protein